MKKSIPFFAILLLTGIYSFVNITSSDNHPQDRFADPDSAKIPEYKIETASIVFEKLKRSLGYFSFDKPSLHLVKRLPNRRFKMAMIYYKSGKIFLEEKAYDLCTSFGKDSLNALSIYLGHELSHYSGKHNISNHYAFVYEDSLKTDTIFKKLAQSLPENKKDSILKIVDESLKSYTSTENEIDADLSGGFLCYLSGYQTFGISSQLLEKTYTDFGIPKEPKGFYPSMEERKQIAIESEEKLKSLIDFFEMGNLLVAVEDFDNAILYYQKVLKEFKSREIYNNIGVLYTLSFLQKANKKRVRFAFPIELDADSRLSNPGIKGNEDNELRKLRFAIENFKKASNLDSDYPIAHLNKSCTHALLSIHASDEDLAKEEIAVATAEVLIAKRLAKIDVEFWKKTLTDIYIQNGIIEALKENKDAANISFKEALKLSPENHLALINYDILNEVEQEIIFGFSGNETPKEEAIENIFIKQMRFDSKKDIKDTIVYYTKNDLVSLWYKQMDHSKVMINFILKKSKQSFTTFHLTDTDYDGATALGIKINDNLEKIKDKYGDPSTYFELGQGSWLIYIDAKIIFQLNADGKLIRWSVYRQQF